MADPSGPAGVRAGAAGDRADLEVLLDQLVRELFAAGLGVASALSQAEGQVAERLTAVVDDADRLIRTVRSAAVTLRADPGREAHTDQAASA